MIVVVGATGKVGSKTVENLLAAGKKVKAIARNAENLAALQAKGAEIAVGSSTDVDFLTKELTGADVVMFIISTAMNAENVGKYQDEQGEAQVQAIKNSGIKNVVMISSQGGHTEEKTGIVAGVARQEKRLNALDGVNVLSLRPTFFMENLFNSIGLIKNMGILGASIKADVHLAMIATQDIAKVAAEKLANLDFKGKSHLDLLGSRDYTYPEVAKILGTAIGKPELPFVEFKYADEKAGLMQHGISESVADAFVGLSEGANFGQMSKGIRNAESTTPTSLEWFAENVFKYAYGV